MLRTKYWLPLALVFVTLGVFPGHASAHRSISHPGAPREFTLQLNLRNSVDESFGVARMSGSLVCGQVWSIGLQVHLRQSLATVALDADGYELITCNRVGSTVWWSASVLSPDGAFRQGKASAFARATLPVGTNSPPATVAETVFSTVYLLGG